MELESIRLYPITAGPPATTISGCLRSAATAEAGLGLSWPDGEKSRLAVRGLIIVGDVPFLVQLSVQSTMTDHHIGNIGTVVAVVPKYQAQIVYHNCLDRVYLLDFGPEDDGPGGRDTWGYADGDVQTADAPWRKGRKKPK